jgi:hypothetical protein
MQSDSPDSQLSNAAPPPGYLVRSLLPIAAFLLLLSTLWIGPWGFLAVTYAWWQVVRRIR